MLGTSFNSPMYVPDVVAAGAATANVSGRFKTTVFQLPALVSLSAGDNAGTLSVLPVTSFPQETTMIVITSVMAIMDKLSVIYFFINKNVLGGE